MNISRSFLKQTKERYDARKKERKANLEKIRSGQLLQADSLERVQKRLKLLGVSLSMAESISRKGSSSEVAPIALERVLGKSDLMGVSYLQLGVQASRSVGRVHIRSSGDQNEGYGTGFMVSPSLMLTNNHVLQDKRQASFSQIEFNYQEEHNGKSLPSVNFNLDPEAFFLTDRELDYTLVALKNEAQNSETLSSLGWHPLIAQEGKVIIGEYVSIIQHPEGKPKQIALRENQLVDVLEEFLHYETDTAPGSSGAPVFNDQWEVVALHHSGVPMYDDDDNILSLDDTPWTPRMGEDRIAWRANEGVRISRIVKHIRNQELSQSQRNLLNQMIEATSPQPINRADSMDKKIPSSYRASSVETGDGSTTWTIPLQVTVRVGQPVPGGNHVALGSRSKNTPGSPPEDELEEALRELEDARNRDYYDGIRDEQEREDYYDDISNTSNANDFFRELSDLVKKTHKTKLGYKPSLHVYPFVDLHPNGKLRSIYSGKEFEPEELIREDLRISQERAERMKERMQELMHAESRVGLERWEEIINLLEAQLPFNCEHVVPQSWFEKKEPMKGDLHHLFACETGCNSFRGNIPYFEFDDFGEAERNNCGKRVENKFEPFKGKGAVARATLYFLLRYPSQVNDTAGEFQKERVSTLLKWHEDFEPSKYEKHRNMAIFEKQGNRNPLIDFPEWADKIAFKLGLG